MLPPGQSGPGSNGNEGVLRIPQSSSIAGTSPSDCLVSNLGHSFGFFYPTAEKQSVYSTAPADWANSNAWPGTASICYTGNSYWMLLLFTNVYYHRLLILYICIQRQRHNHNIYHHYHIAEVFKATSCIGTELLYTVSCWSSCLSSSMWRNPQEYVACKFVLTSPAVSRMSGSSKLDSFHDGWWVFVQLLLFWVLPPGLVQYCSQHSCVIAFKLLLHPFS